MNDVARTARESSILSSRSKPSLKTMLSKSRAKQPATKGFGRVYRSPKKRRNAYKSSTYVACLGLEDKVRQLKDKLAELQGHTIGEVLDAEEEEGLGQCNRHSDDDSPFGLWNDDSSQAQDTCMEEPPDARTSVPSLPSTPISAKVRRIGPDAAANLLYDQWKALIPRLVDPLLLFLSSTKGTKYTPLSGLRSSCLHPDLCASKSKTVLCLFFDRTYPTFATPIIADTILCIADFDTFDVISCECQALPETLVSYGLFPTSPSQPRMAVSILVLQLYSALFERSCDAINAFSQALNSFYGRRSFIHYNSKVRLVSLWIVTR